MIQFFHLYKESKVVKLTDTESGSVVAKGWGRRKWGVVIKWIESSVLQDEQVPEIYCISVNVLNTTKLYTLKKKKE